MSSVEVIIFDLGKVIFDYDLEILAKAFRENSTNAEKFCSADEFIHLNDELFFAYEKGEISSPELYEQVKKLLNLKLDYKKFCDVWNNIFTANKDVMDFICELSKKYNVSLLSNTNDLHFNFIKQNNEDFFKNFKALHVSHLMHCRKPEKQIYQKVINFYNIKPEKLFFTDDLDINIQAARKEGISAYKFTGLKNLKENLISSGVCL
ncbi:HAD family hydrolase [Candidatus Ruminimicrobium bovinum]|uniref:HAD family hydrolase n=1 Tax=Candidatus Ruminimicrobium bovinum TaxID=3242779 RepID=UPI0039B942B2